MNEKPTSLRALLSVSDKTGLVVFAGRLAKAGYALLASGGTAQALRDAGLDVVSVDRLTGTPELLGGRVKTLHPAVHAGILARRCEEDLAELDRYGLAPIDLVVCNLYPFAATVAQVGVSEEAAIEQIDIGGVAMLRAAAKNHASVTVVVDPDDYPAVADAIEAGRCDASMRRALAHKAFRHTASYDAAIVDWFAREEGGMPATIGLVLERESTLRYGENPHQQAALYRRSGSPWPFEVLQGKALSYNNLVDLDAAWAMQAELSRPAVAIVKHANPSGLAQGEALADAWHAALACDPVSAFGSVIAVNREVDVAWLEGVGKLFVEVLAAPAFTHEALDWLARRKPSCRVVRGADLPKGALTLRSVSGGVLAQTADDLPADPQTWRVVTRAAPSEPQHGALAFAWIAVKHVKSNAIVLARDGATVGIGPGQPNRVDSVRLAVERAGERARGAVLASDAFFPFADGIEAAARAGVSAIIQPGGSVRDEEVIAAADAHGLAMVFTGVRHFRH